MTRRVPDDDPRRYLAGWVDYEREQAGPGLPQVDWRTEWADRCEDCGGRFIRGSHYCFGVSNA